MVVGYTALLLDHDTQQHLRAAHGLDHPGCAVNTLRIIERINASRADKRIMAPESVRIVGVHGNDVLKVLIAEVDGHLRRTDGRLYHIVLAAPHAGLNVQVLDDLAHAFLSTIPEDMLRNKGTAEIIAVRPAYALGVERPQATLTEEKRPAPAFVSQFFRSA